MRVQLFVIGLAAAVAAADLAFSDDSGKLGFGLLELRFDDAKLPVKDGEFQFLALTNGIADIRQVYNYSSYTARIDVAGSSSRPVSTRAPISRRSTAAERSGSSTAAA